MMNKSNKEQIKEMLNQVLQGLKDKGIISGGGIVDMNEEMDEKEEVKRAKKNIIEKLKMMGMPQESLDKIQNKLDEIEQGKCKCPNCFNYDTFETVLKDEAKLFDYTTITFNNKKFNIKYAESHDGEEYFMISDGYVEVEKNLSPEQLQEELRRAVQEKDFNKAQAYLNAINELKNKN